MTGQQKVLYLIPATLGDTAVTQVLPSYNLEIIQKLKHFVVEEEKTARRFLIRCGYTQEISNIQFYILNEHTRPTEIPLFFSGSGGNDLGMISEAGLPGVADPGALLVAEAHRLNVRVVPLSGPSSLLMALMSSGLNGQHFAFNGYLPVKGPEKVSKIKLLEKKSGLESQSQLFIEAPYRNNQLIESLLANLRPDTRLCIAANITLSDEWIRTSTIREWKMYPPPDLNRKPAVFIIQS